MLTVQEIMTPRPGTVRDDAKVIEALDQMVSSRRRHVLVVDETGRLTGILADRDLKAALPDRFRPRAQFEEALRTLVVRDVMTRDPLTVAPGTPVVHAIAVMLSCRVSALPVVDDDELIGVLTQTDVLRRYAEDLSSEEAPAPWRGPAGTLGDDDYPARVFVLSSDERCRSMLASGLSDAGFDVQSFDHLTEMMTVWHLLLPDLLIADRSLANHPNLPLLLRSELPRLWIDRLDDRFLIVDDHAVSLELPCPEDLLARAVTQVIAHSEPATAPGAPAGRRPSILIAEDDHVIRRILSHHLQRSGYELFEAHDGREAASLLAERRFDLLLLDINMPFQSGLDILRQLRRDEDGTKRVILSAAHQDETVLEAFQLGAHDFVKKPFDPEVLVRRLDRLLERT
jgi:CheY-like chemotaxis protein/CBS domain-containing protein